MVKCRTLTHGNSAYKVEVGPSKSALHELLSFCSTGRTILMKEHISYVFLEAVLVGLDRCGIVQIVHRKSNNSFSCVSDLPTVGGKSWMCLDADAFSILGRSSDASASKQHPTLTSTGWQITDTREAIIDSSMHRSGHSEHSSDDVSKQDEGHVSDLEDTDNAHIPKVTAATWFKPIPEDEIPATPKPEWTIPPNDFLN
ncbi:hypothetical protein Tco_0616344 [Tanacetum coccineum]